MRTQRANSGHASELFGFGFTGSSRPGDDGTIINRDQLLLLQALYPGQHVLGTIGRRELKYH